MLAAALFLLLSPRAAPGQEVPDLDVERQVRKVEFRGNSAYKAKELKKLLRTRGKSFWRPWRRPPLRQDYIRADRATLTSFYRRHGYLYATVDSVSIRPVGKSASSDVTFHIREGSRAVVDSIRIEGSGPLSEEEFRDALRYEAGSPFDVSVLDASRDSVTFEYADRGYVLARVSDSLAIDGNRVSVLYRPEPGPRVRLGGVTVEGTQKTKPGYVARELLLEPGDVMRQSKLLLSQQRIIDSGLYSDVAMEIGAVDSATSRTTLAISVREKKMGWIDAGIGFGTIDQLRLTGQWGQRNIFRSAMRFVVTGKLGIRVEDDPWKARWGDRRADVALTHPWPLGVRVQTTMGVYAEDQPVIDERDDPFPLRAYGGSLVLARSLLRDTRSSASYEIRHVTADSLLAAVDTSFADTSYTTHRIVLTSERDTRSDIFNPTRGGDILGRIEFVRGDDPGSSGFTNLGLQTTKYVPLRSGAVLALRLRGGFIEPWGARPADDPLAAVPPELDEVPVDERYRTGGASTVRGYGENELGQRRITTLVGFRIESRGGQALLLTSAELRFPFFWIFNGVVFFDGGNVWERPEDIKPSKIFSFAGGAGYNDMRYSGGVGVRIGTPVGPIRFEYGWKIRTPRTPDEPDLTSKTGEFHFSLGQPY